MIKRWAGWALLLSPLCFLLLFFYYPLVSILDVSLRPDGIWDGSGFLRLVTSAYYRDVLVFTLFQALLSTLLTLGLAVPTALIFVRYRFWGRDTLLALVALPFVLPTVVVALAFQALFSERGWLNTVLMSLFQLSEAPLQLQNTLALVLLAHVFYNYALALRLIVAYWATVAPRLEEAARLLGVRGWQLWWRLRLPILRPAILAAGSLVFIYTFSSFGVVLLLGGVRFATLEVQIYYQTVQLFNLPLAAALSLLQIAVMLLALGLYGRWQAQVQAPVARMGAMAQAPRGAGEWAQVLGTVGFVLLLTLLPLLALLGRTLISRDGEFSLSAFTDLFRDSRESALFVPVQVAIGNSLLFALLTTLAATGLGLLAALGMRRWRSRWLGLLYTLPLVTSAVTLGFGFIVALDTPPLDLRSSWVLIPIAHTLVALPFVARSISAALHNLPPALIDAARVHGATAIQVWWRVELPLIGRSVASAAAFAFTMSLGEFGASLFIARPNMPTMPLAMFRLLGQPQGDNLRMALALSVILLLLCLVGFGAIERLRQNRYGEF